MDLRLTLVICGIPYLKNPAINHLTQMFIDSQEFAGVDYLSMLCIKDSSHMIKYNNLVPNKEAHLGSIQQRKLQALVWWEKDFQCRGLAIITSAWTTAELTSFITQINIYSS